jgi:hypothetical protein
LGSSQPLSWVASSIGKLCCNFVGNSCTSFRIYTMHFNGKSTSTSAPTSTLVPLGDVGGVNVLKWHVHEARARRLLVSTPMLCCLLAKKVELKDPISVCFGPKIHVLE